MQILLTHGYFLSEDVKEQRIMRPYPPLGILYLSAYLEQHGVQHEVYDTTFSQKQSLKSYLQKNQRKIVALYTNLMTKLYVIDIVKFIKQEHAETIVILGGPDVRYNAENYLRIGCDYLVIGEGEVTFLDLVKNLQARKSISNIQGIAFLQNGKLIINPEREKIKDLDTLPEPNRSKINLQQYLDAWRTHHGKNAISISTMRGCPYTCKWCSRGVYGLSYRRRSPEKVAEEMLNIRQQYNPDSLWFVDDVFTISHKWLESFKSEIQKRNVLIPYECITRADRLNEQVIQTLKDTGCFRVWIGAESGSQKVIDLMDRRVDVEQVRRMIKLTSQYGIEAGTFIMLGYPGETHDDITETIKHLKESNPDHFTITVAYPIKGTDLYEEVEGRQLNNIEWSSTTDRSIDFERTYRRKYYDYAMKHVINEIHYYKSRKQFKLRTINFKMKSIAARAAMWWLR